MLTTRSRGSRPGSVNAWNCLISFTSSPVSSCNSRRAPVSPSSPISRKPPGNAHILRWGSRPRSTSSTCILFPSHPNTTQSVVTAGWGYL